jgi:hypothetical protein
MKRMLFAAFAASSMMLAACGAQNKPAEEVPQVEEQAAPAAQPAEAEAAPADSTVQADSTQAAAATDSAAH